MPTEQRVNHVAEFKPTSWMGVIAAFACASAVQVLICGLAVSDVPSSAAGSAIGGWVGELAEVLIVLAWMLGPSALATVFAVRKLGFGAGAGTPRMTIVAALSLLVLPVLSAYVGVLISINMFGS